jgi:two-component system response regulator QseB
MRILIVEDDPRISDPVAEHLRRQLHVVEVQVDGSAGLEYARSGVYDLVILDVMLPGLDGLTVCRRLREMGSAAPVLMLTARDAVDDKVKALDYGADDYLVKPFDLAELSARVRALGRRGPDRRRPVLRHGPLELDQSSAAARYGGSALSLTRTEFAILETLMRSPKQVFNSEMLLEKVHAFDSPAGRGTIKTHVANLRRKIRAAGCTHNPIDVLYGVGYRLAEKGPGE